MLIKQFKQMSLVKTLSAFPKLPSEWIPTSRISRSKAINTFKASCSFAACGECKLVCHFLKAV